MKDKPANKITYYLRFVIGIGLLVFLFNQVDASQTMEVIKDVRPGWLLAAAVVIVVIRILMALRWQVLLKHQRHQAGFGLLIRITFISMFFGHFLPGGIGTDVIRGYELIRRQRQVAEVASTIILDRIIGIYSMFFVALIGALLGAGSENIQPFIIPLMTAQVVILAGWVISYFLIHRLGRRIHFQTPGIQRIWEKVLYVLSAVTNLPELRKVFLSVFSLSTTVQVSRCFLFWCMYRAFGADITFMNCLTVIPLVYLLVLIPLSVGGLGVREGALIYLFKPLGIVPEISISVGVISHVLQILVSVPGLFLWLTDRKRVKSTTA